MADLNALIAAAPLCAPTEVERSTGSLRHPEKMQHWDEPTKDALLREREPQSGPVVAVLIGPLNSVVVGPFESPEAAFGWWSPHWNRLRQMLKIVLRPGPAPAPRCPSFRPCGERECPVCGTEAVR